MKAGDLREPFMLSRGYESCSKLNPSLSTLLPNWWDGPFQSLFCYLPF